MAIRPYSAFYSSEPQIYFRFDCGVKTKGGINERKKDVGFAPLP